MRHIIRRCLKCLKWGTGEALKWDQSWKFSILHIGDLWQPQAASDGFWQPLTASDTQTQNKSSILTSRGFQKHITCLDSVHFQIWPFTTSHELKWPRILKNPKDPFLAQSQLSKNIVVEKSQKSHFSKPFSSTTSTDRNGRKPKLPHFYLSSNSCSTVHAPHAPHASCLSPHPTFHIPHSTLHIPHSTFHTPHSSLLTPHSSVLWFY